MVPSGPPNSMGGAQPVGPSLLRTGSSGLLATNNSGGGVLRSQSPYSSLVSPRTQFGNNNGGAASNVAALLNRQSFSNGSLGHGSINNAGDLVDTLSFPSNNPLGLENLQQQQQQQQLEAANEQLSVPNNHHHQQPPVKLENGVKLEQVVGEQNGSGPVLLRSASGMKMEPLPQLQALRSLGGAVKMEPQSSDASGFLHHQQQQQQQLMSQLSKPSMHGAATQLSLLQQQQRYLQMQQQQHQQQLLKNLPLPRSQQQQQQQQLLRQQSLNLRNQAKPTPYEPGTCAKRLTHYMYHQQNRPQDNNIEYWRNFVNEYFAPTAKKRWCVSLYGNGRQTTGVFPQDIWHCEICNHKPGRGFETTVEVLPRLCQIKYASGTLEELLYIDMPRESQNASGQIVLDYTKAMQESVFEQLRVVREGHLRIVFNPDLKIASWEFCARRHEELIPRRSIIPQVSQLGAVVQKYQSAVQNTTGLSSQDLQNSCNSFVACARQMAKALEVPLVNDLGYTKRYVRCLQIAEVVNCMKDLIDYSRQTGTGPMESLKSFPRRSSSGINSIQPRQSEEQLPPSSSNQNAQNTAPVNNMQVTAAGNADITTNNALNCAPSTSTPSPSVVGLLQGSINTRQEHQGTTANSPYSGGNNAQIRKVNSSNSLQQLQTNTPSSFPSPVPSVSNNNIMAAAQHTSRLSSPTASANLPPLQPPLCRAQEAEPNDSQSSVQRILQEMMMSSQLNGVGAMGDDMKRANGITPGLNGVNCLVGNAITNNSGIGGMGFGAMSGLGSSPAATASGFRSMSMNGRIGMHQSSQDLTQLSHAQQQQQDMGSQLLSGLRTANSFNNLQYDWKSSQ